jgi:hypothetical protein
MPSVKFMISPFSLQFSFVFEKYASAIELHSLASATCRRRQSLAFVISCVLWESEISSHFMLFVSIEVPNNTILYINKTVISQY